MGWRWGVVVGHWGGGAHCLSLPPGSHSSCVKLWQCGEGFRRLDPLCDIPLVSGT